MTFVDFVIPIKNDDRVSTRNIVEDCIEQFLRLKDADDKPVEIAVGVRAEEELRSAQGRAFPVRRAPSGAPPPSACALAGRW